MVKPKPNYQPLAICVDGKTSTSPKFSAKELMLQSLRVWDYGFLLFADLCLLSKNKHFFLEQEWKKHKHYKKPSRSEHLHVFQDDFCQQVFEVLVEIFRKECQNRLGRGQVSEDCHPSEAVTSREQGAGEGGPVTHWHRHSNWVPGVLRPWHRRWCPRASARLQVHLLLRRQMELPEPGSCQSVRKSLLVGKGLINPFPCAQTLTLS